MENYVREDYVSKMFFRVKRIVGINASQSFEPDYTQSRRLIIAYCIKNNGKFIANGKIHTIKDGDIVVWKPHKLYRRMIDDNCFHERFVVILNVERLQELSDSLHNLMEPLCDMESRAEHIIPARVVKEKGLDNLMESLLELMRNKNDTNEVLSFGKMLELLCKINEVVLIPQEDAVSRQKGTVIEEVIKYLDANFTKNIKIEDIAAEFHFDRAYLSRKFKEQTGMSIWDYVILRRLNMFNNMVEKDASIEDAAFKAGFRNYSNFYRLYKKHMGISPSDFKKGYKNG